MRPDNTNFDERIQMAANSYGHDLPGRGRKQPGASFGQLFKSERWRSLGRS